jgi:hypothetical protein
MEDAKQPLAVPARRSTAGPRTRADRAAPPGSRFVIAFTSLEAAQSITRPPQALWPREPTKFPFTRCWSTRG